MKMDQIIQEEEKGGERRGMEEKLGLGKPSFQIATKEASKVEVAKEPGGEQGENTLSWNLGKDNDERRRKWSTISNAAEI